MAITTHTAKMLWGRAAARCAMPDCRLALVLDETVTDDPALIGEMAHMVGESVDGPRGVSPLTAGQRDRYDNLVLLCRNHHREIDAQPEAWPVDRLKQVKADHEAWVRQSLPGFDLQQERDDETLALYVDQWAERAHLSDWRTWIGWVFGHGQPSLPIKAMADLDDLPHWVLARVWPNRHPTVRAAMQNFARVLRDFLNVFQEHASKPYPNADFTQTDKFYKIDEWDEQRYRRLFRQFEYHVDLVQDLALELTRAGNLVCDEVRAHILPSFHISEGRLSILSGPHMDMTFRERVVQYAAEERPAQPPYPGLDQFLIDRADRDWHYGEGSPPKD